MTLALALTILLAVFAAVTCITLTIADLPYETDNSCNCNPRFLKMTVLIAALICNALLLTLLHLIIRGSPDIIRTLRLTAENRLSYQGTEYIYGILLLWIPLSAAAGAAIRGIVMNRLGCEKPFIPPADAKRRKLFLTLDLALLAIAVISSMAYCAGGTRHIRLNEVCDAKVGRVSDGGYIELYNDGERPCRIRGLYLTDSEDAPTKYPLPDEIISPGALKLIPLEQSVFSLGRSGGCRVILYDSAGSVIDSVLVDQVREGSYSYCRISGTDRWSYMRPTPGDVNSRYAAVVGKPSFSAQAGFYTDEFYLTVTAPSGAEIHYTTDGSTPGPDSQLYTGPIRVFDRSGQPDRWRSVRNIVYDWREYQPSSQPADKPFVIRAVAVTPDEAVSEQATATYFVGSRFDSGTAVISLVADDEDLFGDNGVYVTGKDYDDWYMNGGSGSRPTANFEIKGSECQVSIEYFEDGRSLTFAQNGGLRIQGGATRLLPLKRLSVFSRREYNGRSTFPVEIFRGKATHSVMLRDGKDNALSMYTVPDRDVATLQSIPVKVYINGEYWYDTYMQEKYNGTYFRQTYGIDEVEFIKTGITDEISAFLDSHDLSVAADYEKFGEMVDIQSYIDYICANVYLGNTDYSEYANTAIWRSVRKENDSYGDGRWRWAFYDMDLQTAGCRRNYGLTDITDAQLDTFNIVCDWDPPVNQRKIYRSLKANPDFRRRFVLSFMDMINTDFTEEKMTALLERFGEDISYHEYFFRDRPDNMINFISKEFELSGLTCVLTVSSNDPDAGSIIVNTSRIELVDGSWSGRYFTDYPVTVTAVPNPGYRFVGWAEGGSDPVMETRIYGGVTASAIFEKD